MHQICKQRLSSLSRKRAIAIATLCFLIFLALAAVISAPSFEQIKNFSTGSDKVLLSENGEVLQTLRTDFSRRRLAWYPLVNFPKALQESIIFSEDRRFYSHFGFDPVGLGRALMANLRRQRIQGASTVTMQLSDLIQEDVLIKNQPIRKGSILHKLVQIYRAIGLEMRWNKTELLEAYLNLIHLRGEYQGVPAVSFAYLKKHPLALNEAESALIAAMIPSPNQKLSMLKVRSCQILLKSGHGSSDNACPEIDSAMDGFSSSAPSISANVGDAPHLARRLFSQKTASRSLVHSTINTKLQKQVIEILERNLYRLRDSNVHDSAAIVTENKTGRVLAYVGAASTSESPHVDGVQGYRQAGSALKPFLYARAIENKTLTAASILLDDPTAISWLGGVYRPSNYDNHFSGPVSVREALASSLNVPAVKTSVIIGLRQTYATLQAIGLTNLKEPDFYGVSMALGAVEVRLEDLANAYRMLSQKGVWSPLRYTVDDENSAPLTASRNVFSPATSFIISSVLSDPNARAIGFGWDNPLETPFWTAVKTGTSKDYRDNWCVGFSEHYTVGVWAGNFNAEAMQKVSGVSGVGPSWSEIMTQLHQNLASHPPVMPETVMQKEVRHQWTSHGHQEFFIKGTEPSGSVIEPSTDQRPQFVFPAEGSVLVNDPHLDQSHVAMYVRFKGSVPEDAKLLWNGKPLGIAKSPFRIDHPKAGSHHLEIHDSEGKSLTAIKFLIRGAQ